MDLVWIALGTLATVILAASANQVAHEFRAWAPWISKRLIRCAVLLLPEESRKRYEEEWSSHIAEVPGDVGKMLTALGFMAASKRMSWDLRALKNSHAVTSQSPHPALAKLKRAFSRNTETAALEAVVSTEALAALILVLLVAIGIQSPSKDD